MKLFKILFKIIAVIFGILAVIASINLLFAFLEKLKRKEAPADGEYYSWKHGRIFFHKRGQGAPVILLHGFEPEQSGKDLDTLSEHLASNHTVYRIDLLGFGLSEKPWITYTNYLYVLMIQNFIKDVVGEKADVVAYGESGLCALQAYHDDPSQIGKIVLVDPCYKESVKLSCPFAIRVKQLIDLPLIGSFLYNLYSLKSGTPIDKDGRHVYSSRLAGYLTADLTGHEDLFGYHVAILNKDGSNNVFALGDVKTQLT